MKRLLTFLLTLLLLLGLATSASAATAKVAVMRVELVEGSVTIKDASGVTLEFFEGMQLHSGYSVETGDDSSAGSATQDRPFLHESPAVPVVPVIPEEPDEPDNPEPDEPIMHTITW